MLAFYLLVVVAIGRLVRGSFGGTLKPVDTAAALASGSTTRPPLPQPRARALPLLLGSGPSPFEATRQPSSGPAKAADLRPNPLTGTRYRLAIDEMPDTRDVVDLCEGVYIARREGELEQETDLQERDG